MNVTWMQFYGCDDDYDQGHDEYDDDVYDQDHEYDDDDDDDVGDWFVAGEEYSVRWKFLPLHTDL